MNAPADSAARRLPDGSKLQNRLLGLLPDDDWTRIVKDLRMTPVVTGETLLAPGVPVVDVFFPNGGVYSITNEMRDGALVEVATVGIEGMLGVGVFLGDADGAGRTLRQVPDGDLPAMPVARFLEESGMVSAFRSIVGRYAQASVLQIMQCTACNALHNVEQRCARWLLQTHDRVGADNFLLKHEFLAIMLGVQRPTVTLVLGALQREGLISTRYGRIGILDRPGLEKTSCECHEVIRGHFDRLGL
jgi:CRP-like cAMP-binding protein